MRKLNLQEKDIEIRKLREEGQSYKTIGQIIGCSPTSIRSYCINNSIKGNIKNRVIGKTFEKSNLLVLEQDLNPTFQSNETAYKCKCVKCGKIKTYRRSNILNGPGCHECEGYLGGRGYREWEIGQQFGFIKVLGKGSKQGYILGECECGTIREFALKHLKGQHHGRTISCGCKQKSSGEIKIENILKENNINYQIQYKIKDFSPYASFDFAIFNNKGEIYKLIEFDGEQHFKPIEHFGGEEKFLIQQNRDKKKNEYCKNNNIILQRIPYYDYDKINLEYLSLSEI